MLKWADATLRRLVRQEAVLGDILEEYAHGRSVWWLWRQIGAAIVYDSWQGSSHHPFKAICAVATAWLFFMTLMYCGVRPLNALSEWLFVTGIADVREYWPKSSVFLWMLICCACTATGWLVTRVYRGHALVCAVSLLAWNVVRFPRIAEAFLSNPRQMHGAAIAEQVAWAFFVMPLCVIAGAAIAVPNTPHSRLTH
jgi:hypothetical protein